LDVTLDIQSIAAGGDGVGRVDKLVVFVPRTAPGDRVRVRIAGGGRFARGSVRELVAPSPDRTEPACAHYTNDRCGGCQLQHMRYDAQLAAKRGIVRDAMERIGKRHVDAPVVHASDAQWRYRTKLTLALRRRGEEWIAGLHPYDAPGRIFALRDCPITDERVVAVWRDVLAASHLLPSVAELRGAVRLIEDGVAFVLQGGKRWPSAERFFAAVPAITALWWETDERPRRLMFERVAGQAHGASFGQVNAGVAQALRARLLERVMAYEPRAVVDAYAGAGDTAAALAANGVAVTAIELDADAARASAARLGAPSRSLIGRVEDRLPESLPADVVVVNPPRGGLHERVPALIAAERDRLRAVLYVSCNPATLARDVARMEGFRVVSLESFDMFPQTAHVETICELVPEAA
jgi:23S rRNA (uracil1939-C5)-methyltransferase